MRSRYNAVELKCIPAVAGGSVSPRPPPRSRYRRKQPLRKVTVPVSSLSQLDGIVTTIIALHFISPTVAASLHPASAPGIWCHVETPDSEQPLHGLDS